MCGGWSQTVGCPDGFYTDSGSSPSYISSCVATSCPSNSTGTNVPEGDCSCDAGFSGTIAATSSSPFFSGSCAATSCPSDSTGTNVPEGDCSCDAGFSGTIAATSSSPFFSGSCEACAAGSETHGVGGSFTASGAVACVACAAGRYQAVDSTGTACAACEAGLYEPSTGSTGCIVCQAGNATVDGGGGSTAVGAVGCTVCAAGKFTADSAGGCMDCPAGSQTEDGNQSFVAAGAVVCALCPAGTYRSASAGPTPCAACPPSCQTEGVAGGFAPVGAVGCARADGADSTACQACLAYTCAWTELPSPLAAYDGSGGGELFGHTAVTVDQKLLVFGGLAASGVARAELLEYSLDANTWQDLPTAGLAPGPRPSPRYGHVVANIGDGRLALFGGFSGTEGQPLADLWEYSVRAGRWHQHAASGTWPAARGGHAAVYDEAGDRLVVAGGLGAGGTLLSEGEGGAADLAVWEFSFTTNNWVVLSAGPDPTGQARLIGSGSGSGRPSARHEHAMVYLPAHGLLLSGGLAEGGRSAELWLLPIADPGTPAWRRLRPTSRPPPLYGHTAVAAGDDAAMFFGGSVGYGTSVSTAHRYSLASGCWVDIAGPALDASPAARFDHAAAALPSGGGGAFAVLGGRTFGSEGTATDAWRCDI